MEKEKKVYVNSYEVLFENGVPRLSEQSYHALNLKGYTDEQINLSIGVMSRKMVEKGVRLNHM
ncbi:hypothetical protein KAR91_56140 [Candidatus Pacearchaeota archaeon]|nr:hypothetical protein [Candidatus Pacearchaeota archaeon]